MKLAERVAVHEVTPQTKQPIQSDRLDSKCCRFLGNMLQDRRMCWPSG